MSPRRSPTAAAAPARPRLAPAARAARSTPVRPRPGDRRAPADRRRAVGRRPARGAGRGEHRPNAPRRLRALAPGSRAAPVRDRSRPASSRVFVERPDGERPDRSAHVLSTIRPDRTLPTGTGTAGRRRDLPRAVPVCLVRVRLGCPAGAAGPAPVRARSSRATTGRAATRSACSSGRSTNPGPRPVRVGLHVHVAERHRARTGLRPAGRPSP